MLRGNSLSRIPRLEMILLTLLQAAHLQAWGMLSLMESCASCCLRQLRAPRRLLLQPVCHCCCPLTAAVVHLAPAQRACEGLAPPDPTHHQHTSQHAGCQHWRWLRGLGGHATLQ